MRNQSSRPILVSFCEQILCALVLLGPTSALAVCKEALQSEDLQQLDGFADADPVATIATANRLLPAAANDPQRRAELYAIIADANNTLSNDQGSLAAVLAGRQSLAAMPASDLRERLALRFELVEADTSQGQTELEAAVHRLQDWESRLPAGRLGQACLRLVRSRVRGRLAQHELAAEDGLTAHALTVKLQAGDAQSEAAIQLATTFRRAGMTEQALPYVDEAIQYTQVNKQLAALSIALFTKAQILGEAARHQDALYVAQQSRELSINLKDDVGRAFSDHEICINRHALAELDQAESACRAAVATFRRNGRLDQALISEERLARIALARGHTAEALRVADAVLAADPIELPPALLPRLQLTRSEALRLQGQPAEALDALRKYHELTAKMDERRRGLAAALLNAQHKVRDSERERDSLSRQLHEEQQHLAAAERARRFALSSAVLGAALAALLGYLLWMSRRHARALRRQELTLRKMAENSPDVLFLIDGSGAILFASRTLSSVTDIDPDNKQLPELFPAEVRDLISTAVRQLLVERQPAEVDLRISIAGHERRFELLGRPLLENDRVIGATLRLSDVTDIRATERKVLDIVSRERQRVSSDLHEGLGQELTGIALQLGAIAAAVRSGKSIDLAQLDTLSQQVDRSIGVTRNLARGFSPMRTDSGSLSASLASLAVEASRRLQISVSSQSSPADITVPDDIGEHLYCIAYEAVTNAARHGQVRTVNIDLKLQPERVVLTVTDDGVGLRGDAHDDAGWGIRMMRYRARLLGATLHIGLAQPGPGTEVSITVSIKSVDPLT